MQKSFNAMVAKVKRSASQNILAFNGLNMMGCKACPCNQDMFRLACRLHVEVSLAKAPTWLGKMPGTVDYICTACM